MLQWRGVFDDSIRCTLCSLSWWEGVRGSKECLTAQPVIDSTWLIYLLVFLTVRIQASAGDWNEEVWRQWAKPSLSWVNAHSPPKNVQAVLTSSSIIQPVHSPFCNSLVCGSILRSGASAVGRWMPQVAAPFSSTQILPLTLSFIPFLPPQLSPLTFSQFSFFEVFYPPLSELWHGWSAPRCPRAKRKALR